MKITFSKLITLLSLIFMINNFSCHALADAKRRIAIFPFDYGSTSTNVGTWDVGNGITSLLITKLVNDGTYSVIERKMIDSLLKEQNFSASDRANPESAIKFGKLLSVDAIITGTVTQFGFEDKDVNIGAAVNAVTGYIPFAGYVPFGGLGFGVHKSKARVAIDARLIDCTTGEILGAIQGIGESSRKGTSLFGSGVVNFESAGFENSLAGEATMQAVNQLAFNLDSMAAKIPDNQAIANKNVTGKIADVDNNNVVVNVGSDNGLSAGDMLKVENPYKSVKDPDSGKTIEELYKTVGVIKLNTVHKNVANGDIIKGKNIKIGDKVSKINGIDIASIQIDAQDSSNNDTTETTLSTKVEKLDSSKKPATKK